MTLVKPKLLDNAEIRQAFPALKDVIYLNTGTYGLMPEPALTAFQAYQADFERYGQAAKGEFYRKGEETRKRIADLIGADPEEIAFTRNATDGINLVLAGIDWKPGDEVITTDEEHPAIDHPLLYLQRMKGLLIRRVAVSPLAEVMLDRLEKTRTGKTRLVILSYITCETGTRLPAPAISQWAAENHILCAFDGAQASGAFKVNVRDMGCDFYASNGHKWLCGPKGTGFFYGKREKLEELYIAHVGAGSLEKADNETGEVEPQHSGKRFEYGTRSWPIYAGLGASLDWFESLGWQNVYGRIAGLTGYLKEHILERSTLKLLSPRTFEQSSGLTSFVIEGQDAGSVSHELREKLHIITRVVSHYNSLRISTAHFNNTEDIDRLIEALEGFLKK